MYETVNTIHLKHHNCTNTVRRAYGTKHMKQCAFESNLNTNASFVAFKNAITICALCGYCFPRVF